MQYAVITSNLSYSYHVINVRKKYLDSEIDWLNLNEDSFGEFDNFFLDLQKVQEIITIKPSCNCFEWHIVM